MSLFVHQSEYLFAKTDQKSNFTCVVRGPSLKPVFHTVWRTTSEARTEYG